MRAPENFTRIIERKRYSIKSATLVAHDAYWDGRNFERHGRNTFLYKTQKGAFFTVTLTQWQGEHESLEPVEHDDAVALYEGPLCEHEVDYSVAFPDVTVVDA